jgi:hypothetical protein
MTMNLSISAEQAPVAVHEAPESMVARGFQTIIGGGEKLNESR